MIVADLPRNVASTWSFSRLTSTVISPSSVEFQVHPVSSLQSSRSQREISGTSQTSTQFEFRASIVTFLLLYSNYLSLDMNPGDDLLLFLSKYLPLTCLFLVENFAGAHETLLSFILVFTCRYICAFRKGMCSYV